MIVEVERSKVWNGMEFVITMDDYNGQMYGSWKKAGTKTVEEVSPIFQIYL